MNFSPEQFSKIETAVEAGIEKGLDPVDALRAFASKSSFVFSEDMPTLEQMIRSKFKKRKNAPKPQGMDWGDPANAARVVKD